MIASTAFILIFLAIGLAIAFVAFGGGVRGAREQLHSQTRVGRRVAFVSVGLVTLGFGVAIPALLLENNADSQSKSGPGGVELSDAQQHGREVFATNCATCHALAAAKAVGRVGPDLDQLIGTQLAGTSAADKQAFILDAIAKGRAAGRGQMPAELVDGEDARDVANFITAVAGR
jgi:mono/diheme cytochrome c family protein